MSSNAKNTVVSPHMRRNDDSAENVLKSTIKTRNDIWEATEKKKKKV